MHFMLKKLPSPSNAVILNGWCGNNHKKLQSSIAEIDNMGDIWRLSRHYVTVFIAFSHWRRRSMLSVTAPAVLLWMSFSSPQLPQCYRGVIKLTPLPQYYRGSTALPIPVQLSTENWQFCVLFLADFWVLFDVMKSSSSSAKQSATKSALNRSAVSLLDASEAAQISAHAASHARPKCKNIVWLLTSVV